MPNKSAKAVAFCTCLSALSLLVGLTGCAGDRHNQNTSQQTDGTGVAEPGYDQSVGQHIEDSRTAERVREALAAGADYRYDGVKVAARDGVVQLSGVVNTSAQRKRAVELTNKVLGVKGIENNLTVQE